MSSATPLDRLFEAAADVRVRAHAPYSGFFVGAALVDREGRVHVGCNVENAAYPQGSCAETGAISAMIAAGGREIVAIAVVGGPAEGEEVMCPPCGGCRQRIREFAAPETPIAIAGPEGIRAHFTLEELLPASFGPANLPR